MDLNQLNISVPAIIVNLLGFLALLYIANRLVFKPIGKVLTERAGEVNSTYNKLDADRAQMEALKADYEKRLAAIEEERRVKVQQAISEAQITRDQIVGEATARAQETVQRAEQEGEREREQAMITLREQIVTLALGAASKVVGENMNDTRQRKLIGDFIASGVAAAPVSTNGAARTATAGAATYTAAEG